MDVGTGKILETTLPIMHTRMHELFHRFKCIQRKCFFFSFKIRHAIRAQLRRLIWQLWKPDGRIQRHASQWESEHSAAARIAGDRRRAAAGRCVDCEHANCGAVASANKTAPGNCPLHSPFQSLNLSARPLFQCSFSQGTIPRTYRWIWAHAPHFSVLFHRERFLVHVWAARVGWGWQERCGSGIQLGRGVARTLRLRTRPGRLDWRRAHRWRRARRCRLRCDRRRPGRIRSVQETLEWKSRHPDKTRHNCIDQKSLCTLFNLSTAQWLKNSTPCTEAHVLFQLFIARFYFLTRTQMYRWALQKHAHVAFTILILILSVLQYELFYKMHLWPA